MTTKSTPVELADKFVSELLQKMNIKAEAIVTEVDGVIYVDVEGEDASHVIGYRGETLDAIQYLTLTVLNQGKQFKKVVVNTGNYREKRELTLITLANRLAEKAYRTGRKVALEPMNPFERRIIHSALQDSAKATTTSEGEDPNRHVVIIPKNVRVQQSQTGGSDFKKKGAPKFKSFGYKRGF